MSRTVATEHPDARREREVSLRLDTFGWEALEAESAASGVPMEDLVAFAVLYYLADVDSGRVARKAHPTDIGIGEARPAVGGGRLASAAASTRRSH